jgi:RNA polymerase sigma-70 factor (ECF subfamily)
MLEVMKSIDSFKGNSALKTWLYSISRRSIYRYRNKRKKLFSRFLSWETSDGVARDFPSNDQALDEAASLKQENRALLEAIGRLPQKQKEAVVLYYLEEHSVNEVAELMNCGTGTIKAHLHRARKKLAGLLQANHQVEA